MNIKTNSYLVALFLSVVFFWAIVLFTTNISGSSIFLFQDDSRYPKIFDLDSEDIEWIESTLDSLPLYEKCAQMIMAPVYRSYMDSSSPDYKSTLALVKDHKIGGLIMFQGELEQEIEFINKMQKSTGIPLLISADFEGGLGTRIDDALEFPHAMALGAATNSQNAYDMGKAIAVESKLMGVHQIFAPVADINNNELNPVINIRSFSESKYTVSEFVSSFVLGTKQANVIATVKHFPGHGNTEIDSHTELPTIRGGKDHLFEYELYPFINAIESGVQSIMVGHLQVPAYDLLPASLSKIIITDLLINTLGFDGLIITDAMNMEAINKYFTHEEYIMLAVNAGNDIILMPPEPVNAINIIYYAVLNGEITEERINYSVRKILAAKRWLKINEIDLQDVPSVINEIQNDAHIRLAKKIAQNSITLLKNDKNILPIDPVNYQNIACVTVTDGSGGKTAKYFNDIIKRRWGNVKSLLITNKTRKRGFGSALASLKKTDLILLPVFMEVEPQEGKEKIRKEQMKFIKEVINLRAPVVIISFKNPYLLNLISNTRTYLNTYSYSYSSQDASLKALCGEIDIKGKLPVSIPGTKYHIGMGKELNKSISTKLTYSLSDEIKFISVDNLIINSIREGKIPNARLSIGLNGQIIYQKTFGAVVSSSENKLSQRNQFNIGTLTEPVALSTAVMILVDEGLLSIYDYVYHYLPGFEVNDKKNITIKNLLLHNSGLGQNINSLNTNWSKEKLIDAVNKIELKYKTNETEVYSVLNNLILQLIVENISGETLGDFLQNNMFNPVGMSHTYLNEKLEGNGNDSLLIRDNFRYGSFLSSGNVIKKIMGGAAGFDGMISTVADLSIFAQLMIQKGYYNGEQFISASIINEFVKPNLPESYAGLGWQSYISAINISYDLSKTSYGYNSNNGSSLWIDPDKKMFIIFLTDSDIKNTKSLIVEIQSEIIKNINNK